MSLGRFLVGHGYVALRLRRNRTGHFELSARVNGRRARLVVDTGASHCAMDAAAAKALGLSLRRSSITAGGLGTKSMEVSRGTAETFEVGRLRLGPVEFAVLDLSHVNQALRERGALPIHGVVGADFLRARRAVIDVRGARLYLR
jgi:clan AA aspartic protease (TIGR02281 family)